MKLLIKILFIIIVVLALIYGVLYAVMHFKGKAIVITQLERATQKKVSIGHFNILPPCNIKIKDLNIAGLVQADSIFISPSFFGLFTGRMILNKLEIDNPVFTCEINLPKTAAGSSSVGAGIPGNLKNGHQMRLIFKNIRIKDGKMNFIDHKAGPDGIKILIKDINFSLSNFYVFPLSVITNFELKARIPWQGQNEEGKIEAEGWLNLVKKDMQATLKIADIDGVYLYPYYSQWVDLEKARIGKARLNFTSNINSLNNKLVADCHLELADIVRKPRPQDEPSEKAERITDTLLDIFRALNQGNIVLDFKIRTKMDHPEFGFGDLRTAIEDKITLARKNSAVKPEDVLMLPGNLLQGTVKSAADLTTAVISGVGSVGVELKKVALEAFRREKK